MTKKTIIGRAVVLLVAVVVVACIVIWQRKVWSEKPIEQHFRVLGR